MKLLSFVPWAVVIPPVLFSVCLWRDEFLGDSALLHATYLSAALLVAGLIEHGGSPPSRPPAGYWFALAWLVCAIEIPLSLLRLPDGASLFLPLGAFLTMGTFSATFAIALPMAIVDLAAKGHKSAGRWGLGIVVATVPLTVLAWDLVFAVKVFHLK